MEALNRHIDVDRIHTRLLNLGLMLNVLIPMILLAGGVFLKSRGVSLNAGENLKFMFLAMIVVALGEIPVIYLVKKNSLSARKACQGSYARLRTEQVLYQWGVLIFSIALSPTIYGLVYYLLGGSLERFVLFVAITLFCFLVFKPKLGEIRSFAEKRSEPTESAKGF